MNGSPSAILTGGLGSWGSPSLILTLGLGIGSVTPTTTTVDKGTNKTFQNTAVVMNTTDVPFTFSPLMRYAQVQASAASSSMYFAGASSGHAAVVLPNGQGAEPLEVWSDMAGQTVTFNGSSNTTVDVVEYFYAST